MPNLRDDFRVPLDATGFLLSGLGLSALIFGLTGFSGRLLPGGVAPALLIGGLVLLSLYVFHARRTAHPILDLGLLRIGTFRASLLGGILFRIGAGGIPFLLPLLLQLVFGYDPFSSGSITFVAAIGAISMKFVAQPILRRFGFRSILLWNSLISAVFVIAFAFFVPGVPVWLIMAVILVGGFFRSLQFTSLGAIAYADMPQEKVSQASTMFSAIQQTAIAAGVALAAFSLETTRHLRGEVSLASDDFAVAFGIIGVITAASFIVFWRMPHDAGEAVSGHRSRFT
jgi:Na+/melibiose symporter-like transporter